MGKKFKSRRHRLPQNYFLTLRLLDRVCRYQTDKDIINEIMKQYKTAWKALARL